MPSIPDQKRVRDLGKARSYQQNKQTNKSGIGREQMLLLWETQRRKNAKGARKKNKTPKEQTKDHKSIHR
jgi:hypothetical protein